MKRENATEILEKGGVPDELVKRAYRDLARIHRWLGDTRFVVRAIRRDPLPVRRILDVGCATGEVSGDVRRMLGVEVLGIDVCPRRSVRAPVVILQADATRDPLPPADVAFSMCLGHHLSEADVVNLIRNVGRSCRRFILVDLVRHPLPLALFRLFLAPFLSRIAVQDGRTSIRRAFTTTELPRVTASALAGLGATFRHSVAPLYARQVIDISYASTLAAPRSEN